MHSAQNRWDKTGMLCFQKQRHTVSIQRRLLGSVKAWASLPSRMSYPSSIKVYKSVYSQSSFLRVFQIPLSQCKLFCTKKVNVDFSYSDFFCVYNPSSLLFLSRTGKIGWGQKCEITQLMNHASLDFILIKDKDIVIKPLLESPLWEQN